MSGVGAVMALGSHYNKTRVAKKKQQTLQESLLEAERNKLQFQQERAQAQAKRSKLSKVDSPMEISQVSEDPKQTVRNQVTPPAKAPQDTLPRPLPRGTDPPQTQEEAHLRKVRNLLIKLPNVAPTRHVSSLGFKLVKILRRLRAKLDYKHSNPCLPRAKGWITKLSSFRGRNET